MIRERYYRCYFFRDGQLVRDEDVYSHDDAGAVDQAELFAAVNYSSIEIWRGHEHVATIKNALAVRFQDRDELVHT